VGSRAGLNAMAKSKIPVPTDNGTPVVQPVATPHPQRCLELELQPQHPVNQTQLYCPMF